MFRFFFFFLGKKFLEHREGEIPEACYATSNISKQSDVVNTLEIQMGVKV